MSVTAALPSASNIRTMQANAAEQANRMRLDAQNAAQRQATQAQSAAQHQAAQAQSAAAAEGRRVDARRDQDTAFMQSAFQGLSGQAEGAAWERAMEAVTHNDAFYARASSEELDRAVSMAGSLQDYSDERHFGMIDNITGGRDWRTTIIEAAGRVVDAATGMADKYRDEVMTKVLDGAAKFAHTTMGNLQRMAEGFLSEGAMNQINRSAGEVMNQLGRAGQAALYSRAAMIGQTTEEAQAQAIQLMPGALGAVSQAYGQSMEILGRPGVAAAQYTDTMMKYMNPDRVDAGALYGQGMGARLAGGMVDANSVFSGTLQSRTGLANTQLNNLAGIRRDAASTSHSAWQFGQTQQADLFKFGQTQGTDLFKFGQQQGASNYFEQLSAGIQQAGDVMRHQYDVAGLRVAEQTANNDFSLAQQTANNDFILAQQAINSQQAAAASGSGTAPSIGNTWKPGYGGWQA